MIDFCILISFDASFLLRTAVLTVCCMVNFQPLAGWCIAVSDGQRNHCSREMFSDLGRSAAQ